MPDVPAYYGPLGELVISSERRWSARQIARARSQRELAANLGVASVEAAARVTEAAMLATAHISAMEALLVSRVPHAEARLRHIADAGCASMANTVLRTGGGWS